MRKYVIMGVQGSGKGTQSELLCEGLGIVHISVGDIFRWQVQNHTKLGAQVRRTMAGGELVSDDLVEGVVSERLAELLRHAHQLGGTAWVAATTGVAGVNVQYASKPVLTGGWNNNQA